MENGFTFWGWVGDPPHGGRTLQALFFSVQNPPQTGEQELESLVLKLSVLKDFLSGIQKKVALTLTSDLCLSSP